MPSVSDHDRRDAWSAMRAEIRIQVSRYVRRMEETAKGIIQEELESATQNGEPVEGTQVGRVAAAHAIATYIGTGGPTPVIEAPSEAASSED
jgi:hypothetical protein